jgi:hypothetical protein
LRIVAVNAGTSEKTTYSLISLLRPRSLSTTTSFFSNLPETKRGIAKYNYSTAKGEVVVHEIFDAFAHGKRFHHGSVVQIAGEHFVPDSTLRRWLRKWLGHSSFRRDTDSHKRW